jgi:hypothetical protein
LLFQTPTEICSLSNNINDYYYVSQGKTTIPNLDDGEEGMLTDVSGSVRQQRESRSLEVETLSWILCASCLF